MNGGVRDERHLVSVAESVAREAGAIARNAFAAHGGDHPEIGQKRDYTDIVTETDREVEDLVSRRLREEVPHSIVVGEERGIRGDGGITWYVDPIDGTSNFASGLPFYSVSIGVADDDGLVAGAIYDPERDEMFTATTEQAALNGVARPAPTAPAEDSSCELMTSLPFETPGGAVPQETLDAYLAWLASFRAIRRFGSCALHLAYVAAGRIAVCAEQRVNPWDIAAGVRLVRSSGGEVHAWGRQGQPVDALTAPADAYSLIAHGPGFDLGRSALSSFVDLARAVRVA